jgi:hypothetical protein
MHRYILGLTDRGTRCDHRDNNGMNNQRSNLRIATAGQNQHNCGSRGGKSRFKGVSWSKAAGKWVAQICKDRQRRHIGLFETEEAAAAAYDKSAIELHGAFAYLNFPADKPDTRE